MIKQSAFTLIELVITIAIVGILAAVALPMFIEQMRAGRRSEAFQALSEIQLREEKWRLTNTTYTNTLANVGAVSPLPSGYYTLAIATPSGNCASGVAASSANSYSITATAAGDQSSDTKCATIVLTSLCGVISKTSTGGGTCWK